MTIELKYLVFSIILGIIQLMAAAMAGTMDRGLRWNMGPRDTTRRELSPVAGRLERAFKNFLETFAFFAAAVLVAHALNVHSWMTTWGVMLYFWARVAYVPIYAAGISALRTAVWGVSVVGIVLLLAALLTR
ncbi:MAPEG family protein [Variibacter gotjawalensis]|uniref:MAPEG family protein n=1 Tax=Variibacter gotjawalensis TaxID=1333996 RepID=A0A0S3PTZ5_9BRAD|nr:MAPEG family protein [Variibacter gotjawalensis]NIK49613.1 putative MAPEG superfamily protein [Variibacter gotjawalensis]RZS45625.1 putative MAPEG superfamily protein [Variibacter gotjawalensis]BAT59296.1 MAPEG family protein [Variibacter gotjawalensis]